MKLDAIRQTLHKQPFKPFYIHSADGGRLGPVLHQDFIGIDPGGRELSFYTLDGFCHTIDLMLITRLETKLADGIGEAQDSLREQTQSSMPMDFERLRQLLHAQPFHPFCFNLIDGERIPVEYPDSVALTRRNLELAVILPDDTVRIIEIASIKQLEVQSDRGGK